MTIAADWEDLSQLDPLWAILSESDKRGQKWDLAEFFARGEKDIAALMERARSLGLLESRTGVWILVAESAVSLVPCVRILGNVTV